MALLRATKLHALKSRATKVTNAFVRGAKKVLKHPATKKFLADAAPQVMNAMKDPEADLPSLGQNLAKSGMYAMQSAFGGK